MLHKNCPTCTCQPEKDDILGNVMYQMRRLQNVDNASQRTAWPRPGVTVRDLKAALKRKNYTREQIEDALVELYEQGKVEFLPEEEHKRGRPTIHFQVVQGA